MRKASLLPAVFVFALAACGGPGDDAAAGQDADQAAPELPSPDGDPAGSVTGMPAAGSGEAQVPPASGEVADAAIPSGIDGLTVPGDPLSEVDILATGRADISISPQAPPATVVDTDGAMSTIRRYYASISSADYAGAHRMWSGNGSASGQSLDQFTTGFADTADVRVHMMEPEETGAAAGSRYVRIPVTIDSSRRDGSTVQFTGSYTLRRPGDGSGDWRIDSADLREVQR